MFGFAYNRDSRNGVTAPLQFRDLARNAIFKELPHTSEATLVRSAPTHPQTHKKLFHTSHRSLASSVFSAGKRLVRSAPLMYLSLTATIPEDSEPVTTTVEQFLSDVSLHEATFQQSLMTPEDLETWQILLGSNLTYQNVPELLVDWNLNTTRCKLMLVHLPMVLQMPDFKYTGAVPQLVGDLAYMCDIMLLSPSILDKELIYTLISLNLYQEHNLDQKFKKLVAEISVKQLRLLQIGSDRKGLLPIVQTDSQLHLRLEYKSIAVRNYLVNLAAAATTAVEYKTQLDEMKRQLRSGGDKRAKLSKEDKKRLWDQVRSEVFKRAELDDKE